VLVTASPEPFAVLATVVVVVPLLTSVWSVLDADAVLLPLVLLTRPQAPVTMSPVSLPVVVWVLVKVLLVTAVWLVSVAVPNVRLLCVLLPL